MDLVSSLKRFTLVLMLVVAVTFGLTYAFDELIAKPTSLHHLIAQTIRTVIVIVAGSLSILFIRRSKPLISRRVGAHASTVFQFFMVLVIVIVMVFAVLNIFEVPSTTLLVGGGIVSITLGLVISTFVGDVLAGTLVFVTSPFRVGDTVLVNNVPGKVEEITTILTRIRNDVGGIMVVPNTAIMQGAVIVTRFPKHQAALVESSSRLPYDIGDRVFTTYLNAEGFVTELNPFQTKILLDSGREITFMNTSVFTGAAAVARISQPSDVGKETKKAA